MPKAIKYNGYMTFIDVEFAKHLERRIAIIRNRLMDLFEITTGAEKEKTIRRYRRMMDIQIRIDVATLDYLDHK